MKKLFLFAVVASSMLLTSCSSKISSNQKHSIPFPGMTVTRADYKLSKDVSAEIEVKAWSTLLGYLKGAKAVGENKRELRQGIVNGYGLDLTSQIAVYRLLDANPNFDYLTNIRITKEYTRKWLLFLTKYNTKIKVTAKGITLNTEK
jgi:hypothetical protein